MLLFLLVSWLILSLITLIYTLSSYSSYKNNLIKNEYKDTDMKVNHKEVNKLIRWDRIYMEKLDLPCIYGNNHRYNLLMNPIDYYKVVYRYKKTYKDSFEERNKLLKEKVKSEIKKEYETL